MSDLNWFPAILIAGSPNCGKSVLAFLLTQRLRQMGISHYLLRTAPDGEGNWFLEVQNENAEIVRQLRTRHKRPYSNKLVQHMTEAIVQRRLPLLVDIGGEPQGNQFDILNACTHAILLYRTEEQRSAWQPHLADLAPIAELRSDIAGSDCIEAQSPLQGIIAGLDRKPEKRKTGAMFEALLARVASICRYTADELENRYRPQAPFAFYSECQIAHRLGLEWDGERPQWRPADIPLALAQLPTRENQALYGYGPVWLAAAAAVHALPGKFALFDTTYGWLEVPRVQWGQSTGVLEARVTSWERHENPAWMARHYEILLIEGILKPGMLTVPAAAPGQGVILSGKLPRWAFAGLARAFAPNQSWVGVDDPKNNRVVIVHGQSSFPQVGHTIDRPVLKSPE